jgi:uncharacterized CHY-type Zn-finger protein
MVSFTVKRSEKKVDLLASLCNTYHTFEDCLRGMMEKAYKIISETLNRKPILASDCKTDLMNDINTGITSCSFIPISSYFNLDKTKIFTAFMLM